MRPYNVVLIQPPDYVHWMGFLEIGKLLAYSFQSLGFPCQLQTNRLLPQATNVLLGYNLIGNPAAIGPADYIVYQLEQLSDREGWFQPNHLELFKRAREVWDYSPENVDFLKARGVENVRLVPIGFHRQLQTIVHREQDIDVLFYGSMNDRRRGVLEDLARSCRLERLFGVYGQQRDDYVARSKIVLNVHFYDAQVMEQARISYLLNNRCFVVSEQSPRNPFQGGIITAPLDQLAECCRTYLDRPEDRYRIAEAGFSLFQQRPMTEYLKQVIS